MAFLNWESKYELGIPEIDNQHRKWVAILNKFYDQISKSELKKNMLEMLDEAFDYTKFHFREEEKFMASINYVNIDDQKRMHKDIIATLENFKKSILSDKTITSMNLTNEMKKWFKEHILVEDKKYADFLKRNK